MNEDLEDWFSSLAQQHDQGEEIRLPIKGVTVRLDAHQRAEITALCSIAHLTRQDLLEAFINSGLKSATEAYLGNSPPEVQSQFHYEVYECLVSEGIPPEVSEQMAGIQLDIFEGDNQQ